MAASGYLCRFFDIVGLDEGTCGRRPAGCLALSRRWMCRKQISCSRMSFTYPFVRICAERLLDVMLAGEGIPPWLVGDINLRV